MAMNTPGDSVRETYNPWTIVNLVFSHLAEEGLRPMLGEGDPAEPAAALLRMLGIVPSVNPSPQSIRERDAKLAELRAAHDRGTSAVSD
jgi:hypothetical protein